MALGHPPALEVQGHPHDHAQHPDGDGPVYNTRPAPDARGRPVQGRTHAFPGIEVDEQEDEEKNKESGDAAGGHGWGRSEQGPQRCGERTLKLYRSFQTIVGGGMGGLRVGRQRVDTCDRHDTRTEYGQVTSPTCP